MKPLCAALTVALALAALAPAPGHAHPLGNFSINHHAALRVEAEGVEIAYVIDMAEIPTFQELQEQSLVPDASHPSVAPYLSRTADSLGAQLHVEINGSRRPLRTLARDVAFPPGAGDLPTLRLRAVYRVDLDPAPPERLHELRYRDANFPGRAGWKEIVAVAGVGASLAVSSAPEEDRSHALTDYQADLLQSPPQDLEARVVFAVAPSARATVASTPPPSGPAAFVPSPDHRPERAVPDGAARREPPDAGRQEVPPSGAALVSTDAPRPPVAVATPRSAFTQLTTTRELSIGVILLAMVTALGVGAVHALEPGHGKTIVAAYLVGARGTARHAVFLGLVVTASHTAGVFLLGLITLYASRYMVPERLYPWLGAVSGLTIAALGFWLLLQRVARGHRDPHGHHHDHDHDHDHHHGHDHHPHDHPDHYRGHAHGHHHHGHGHGHGHHHHDVPANARQLLALGITGGIVPCPAALVVLLSAIALRRTGFGLLLIVAFSVGLAAVLVGIGLLMVYARRFMARVQGDGPLIRRWLPLASAAVIMILGVIIAVQALVAGGIIQIRL
jgi:ABC-type nickel/cobalt efflux system permease component RcnA